MKLLGSGVRQTISFNHIANSLLIFPSSEEQTAIAHFLDQKTAQIDAAIAIKEQQIALLKERKQILIQQAVTQGLDPTVPMKDSGVEWIGEIPAHWVLTKAKYYANVFVPERAKPELNERSDGFPWVTTENLRSKYLNLESSRFFVSTKEAKKTGSRHLAANSVRHLQKYANDVAIALYVVVS